MLRYSWPGACFHVNSFQKTQSPCYPVPQSYGPFHYPSLLSFARSPQSPRKKTAREKKVMTHSRHITCKTDIEAKKRVSNSSENSAERAVCRQSLAGTSRLAVGIHCGFSVSESQSQFRTLLDPQIVVGTDLKVKPTNKPLPIFSSRSAIFSNAVCLSCTSLYLAISASLLKSSK